jgi:hypothetical protein
MRTGFTQTLTHIYVRDARKGFFRPFWSTGAEVYCGMCSRDDSARWSVRSARFAPVPLSAF